MSAGRPVGVRNVVGIGRVHSVGIGEKLPIDLIPRLTCRQQPYSSRMRRSVVAARYFPGSGTHFGDDRKVFAVVLELKEIAGLRILQIAIHRRRAVRFARHAESCIAGDNGGGQQAT